MQVAAETIVAVPTIATTTHAVRPMIGSWHQMLVNAAAIDIPRGTIAATKRIREGSLR